MHASRPTDRATHIIVHWRWRWRRCPTCVAIRWRMPGLWSFLTLCPACLAYAKLSLAMCTALPPSNSRTSFSTVACTACKSAAAAAAAAGPMLHGGCAAPCSERVGYLLCEYRSCEVRRRNTSCLVLQHRER